jgi:LmbE family N-acetylglucosaminyl deacetylase
MTHTSRTILAIGAHAGYMEVSCGAVLALHIRRGDRVVLYHLTLGEGGNPSLSPATYGAQKRREAEAIAKTMGAEVLFGPYKDGEIPDSEEARRVVGDVIRQVAPTHIITHWRNSIHPDHAKTHAIVNDAVLLASLEGVVTKHPRHRGVKGIYFTENWEDPEEFTPYFYVDVSEVFEEWWQWVVTYQFIKGGISSFPYHEYYSALARVRGAEAGRHYAVALTVDPFERKRVVEELP